MRGLMDFLVTVHVMKGLVGRGPAIFGCLFVLAIPLLLLAVLMDQLNPRSVWTLAWKMIGTILKGFHL